MMLGAQREYFICNTICVILSLPLAAQAQQPFEQFGIKVPILSLSNGRYPEYFPNDSLRRIGTVVYNTRLKEVAYLLPEDSLVGRMKSEVTSRWLTIDPLAEKFAHISPYVFVANNPIRYMDPDGRELVDPNGKTITFSYNKDGSIEFSKNVTESMRTFVTELSKNEVGRETLAGLVNIATKVGVEITEERGEGYKGPEVEGHTETGGTMIDLKTGKEVYKSAEIAIFMGTHKNETETGSGQYSKSSSGKFINGVGVHEGTHVLTNIESNKQTQKNSGLKGTPLDQLQQKNRENAPNEQERKANSTYPQ